MLDPNNYRKCIKTLEKEGIKKKTIKTILWISENTYRKINQGIDITPRMKNKIVSRYDEYISEFVKNRF
jgi:uncharacterized protein YutE (UPF0331/DUF86 family)